VAAVIAAGLNVQRIEVLRGAAVDVAKGKCGTANQTDAGDLVRCAQLRDDVVAIQ
jgi:hypothetical protein